jgi:hypothetical protein
MGAEHQTGNRAQLALKAPQLVEQPNGHRHDSLSAFLVRFAGALRAGAPRRLACAKRTMLVRAPTVVDASTPV